MKEKRKRHEFNNIDRKKWIQDLESVGTQKQTYTLAIVKYSHSPECQQICNGIQNQRVETV